MTHGLAPYRPASDEPPAERSFRKSARLVTELRAVIPGGAHTYAKCDDQYPEHMAPVIVRGRGAHVWDVDGNEFIEYGSGLRSVILGHAHPRVNAAAMAAMDRGTNFVRPSVLELEAAEAMLSVLPRADMVKFAKNGSDVTTAAVRLARAVTGRDLVAICADQPFFSVDDWFIGAAAMPAGIPQAVRDLTVGFPFNDLPSLTALLDAHPGEVACVVLEAATAIDPAPGYFAGLRKLCDERGVLIVLDEMITGFRWALGGAQSVYDIDPDLSTFGKAIGNGFAVSALAGKREYMQRGGFDHGQERVFLLSTTHGAETHALAAAIAVVDEFKERPVPRHLAEIGSALRDGVRALASAYGIEKNLLVLGPPQNLVFATLDQDGERSQLFRTVFMEQLLLHGVLATSFVVSDALSENDVARTLQAVDAACAVYRRALEDGVERHLHGRPVRPALRPY